MKLIKKCLNLSHDSLELIFKFYFQLLKYQRYFSIHFAKLLYKYIYIFLNFVICSNIDLIKIFSCCVKKISF